MIDYFYDLSLLREGDGINFQKASATLDGCVKIYSSRVDSAVTETGRLINGLATSKKNQIEEEGDADEEDDEEDELDPNAPVKQKKSKASISHKNTIVEFKVIKLKKMDLELYVDPLFKKALTDFDEGGSKSLLLNMLNVNEEGKIMFDTTDSTDSRAFREETVEPQESAQGQEEEDLLEADQSMHDIEHSFAEMDIDEEESTESMDQKILQLGNKYFSNLGNETWNVCPSMDELEAVLNQKATSSDLLKGLENAEILDHYSSSDAQNDDFDLDFSGGNGEVDFGSFQDQNNSKYPGNKTSIFFDDLEDEADDYGITMRQLFNESKVYGNTHDEEAEQVASVTNIPDENLLAYFDENQRKNWAGPEHWKIQRLKNNYKPSTSLIPNDENTENGSNGDLLPKKRKTKEPFVIDFLSDDYPDEDELFEPVGSQIMLPKKEWVSKTKHVLPDDRHFTTKNFINLFLKEKLINSTFNKVKDLDSAIDESLYAEHLSLNAPPENVNNADFYNDNGPDLDFDDFGDDHITPQSQEVPSSQLLIKSQGKQSPLSYSRVAKKVDVKLLKDNLLESLQKERSTRKSMVLQPIQEPQETLKFTDVVAGLNEKYDKETKKDLSTSFCFICLLHLANENGFTIENTSDNSDLIIDGFQDGIN